MIGLLVTLAWIAALIGVALLLFGIKGAVHMFTFATEQGPIGIALYAVCWIFLLPVMLTASVIVGCIVCWVDDRIARQKAINDAWREALYAPSDTWARFRSLSVEEEDRRDEKHRQRLVAKAQERGERDDL